MTIYAQIKIVIKYCLFGLLSWINKDFQPKFSRAKRACAAQSLLHHAPKDCSDIVFPVLVDDEYGVSDLLLSKSDIIIDIGAHIGSFAVLCHHLGSRHIMCYEPDPKNYKHLTKVKLKKQGINIYPVAVFRSDIPSEYTLLHSGWQENSGAGNVMMNGHLYRTIRKKWVATNNNKQSVSTISLDEILDPFDHVRLLKIDCEGSEFPVLLTSTQLHKINHIVGEYHEYPEDIMHRLHPKAKVEPHHEYTLSCLRQCLENNGFTVKTFASAPHLGLFSATRNT